MTRGRPPVRTRNDIRRQIDMLAAQKGIAADSKRWELYMGLHEDERPSILAMARQYKTSPNIIKDRIRKWRENA